MSVWAAMQMMTQGGGVGAVEVVQTKAAVLTSGDSLTFDSSIADGERIVIFHSRPSSGAVTLSPPSGFSTVVALNGIGGAAACFSKVASGESGGYAISSTAASNNLVLGYVLSACSVGNTDTDRQDTAGTAITAGPIDVSSGSLALLFRSFGTSLSGGSGGDSFNNSFTAGLSLSSGTGITAEREYLSAALAQSVTDTWVTSVGNRRALLVEFAP